MKFDLNAAKAGAPLRDGIGRPAIFVAHVIEGLHSPTIVAVVEGQIETYTEKGWYLPGKPGSMDLTTDPMEDPDED